MKKRGRKEESSVSLEYLKEMHQIHDDWLYHQSLRPLPAPVITINADRDLHEMVEEFEKCKTQIFNGVTDDTDKNSSIITVPTNCILSEIRTGISD